MRRQFCWQTLGSRRFLASSRGRQASACHGMATVVGSLVPLRATRSESVSASRTVCASQSPQPPTEFRPRSLYSTLKREGRIFCPPSINFVLKFTCKNRLFYFADLEHTLNFLELLDHLIRQWRIHIDKGICVIPFGFICHSGDI